MAVTLSDVASMTLALWLCPLKTNTLGRRVIENGVRILSRRDPFLDGKNLKIENTHIVGLPVAREAHAQLGCDRRSISSRGVGDLADHLKIAGSLSWRYQSDGQSAHF